MNSILAQGQPVPLAAPLYPLPAMAGIATAGSSFPSPAEDMQEKRITLRDVIHMHEQFTHLVIARGDSMTGAGISDGDVLVVTKNLKPKHGSIVLAAVEDEYVVKYFYQRAGKVKLRSGNPNYEDIIPQEGQTLEVWGVVTNIIKRVWK